MGWSCPAATTIPPASMSACSLLEKLAELVVECLVNLIQHEDVQSWPPQRPRARAGPSFPASTSGQDVRTPRRERSSPSRCRAPVRRNDGKVLRGRRATAHFRDPSATTGVRRRSRAGRQRAHESRSSRDEHPQGRAAGRFPEPLGPINAVPTPRTNREREVA